MKILNNVLTNQNLKDYAFEGAKVRVTFKVKGTHTSPIEGKISISENIIYFNHNYQPWQSMASPNYGYSYCYSDCYTYYIKSQSLKVYR
jgi:hypothetical protein